MSRPIMVIGASLEGFMSSLKRKYPPPGIGMSESSSPVGMLIREARLKAGWSQAELARRANFCMVMVSRVELGRSGGETTILLIARALNLDRKVVRREILKMDTKRLPTAKGNFIRVLRLGLGLTRKELAKRMGVTSESFSLLETSSTETLQYTSARKLAEALGVEISVFSRFLSVANAPATNSLGALVRTRRMELGLSLKDLAVTLGVSKQAANQIETGVIGLTSRESEDTVTKLASALEIPLEALLDARGARKVTRKRRPKGTLGAWLTEARIERGLSQTAFAKELGVATSAASRYENGRGQPSSRVRKNIEKILGHKIPDDLLS